MLRICSKPMIILVLSSVASVNKSVYKYREDQVGLSTFILVRLRPLAENRTFPRGPSVLAGEISVRPKAIRHTYVSPYRLADRSAADSACDIILNYRFPCIFLLCFRPWFTLGHWKLLFLWVFSTWITTFFLGLLTRKPTLHTVELALNYSRTSNFSD